MLWDSEQQYHELFINWWNNTTSAQRIKASDKEYHPRWDSRARRHAAWDNYQQCAREHDGEPFLMCLHCKAFLRHPTVRNTGTTNIISHINSAVCKKRRRSDASRPFHSASKARSLVVLYLSKLTINIAPKVKFTSGVYKANIRAAGAYYYRCYEPSISRN